MEMYDEPNDDDLLAANLTGIAYHETGHVVMHLHYYTIPNYVTLRPSRGCLSRVNTPLKPYSHLETLPLESPDTEATIRRYAHSACAGGAAEAILNDEVFDIDEVLAGEKSEVIDDLERLVLCISLMLKQRGVDDTEEWPEDEHSPRDLLFMELWDEAVEILKSHWPAVEAIVKSLIEREGLKYDELLDIYNAADAED